MKSDLNSWLFPLFKDTLFFQIGPLVQKIWGFDVGPPPLFSRNFQKINPYISETDHTIKQNFRFGVWGPKSTCMPNFIKF